jgi:very-short-patch-repair endonuclease
MSAIAPAVDVDGRGLLGRICSHLVPELSASLSNVTVHVLAETVVFLVPCLELAVSSDSMSAIRLATIAQLGRIVEIVIQNTPAEANPPAAGPGTYSLDDDEATKTLQSHERNDTEAWEERIRLRRYLLSKCESPLEQRLLMKFMELTAQAGANCIITQDCVCMDFGPHWIELLPQAQICDGRYRADFLLDVRLNDGAARHAIVVEVDGHDYHERTKEQARRDKRRDRDMAAEGLTVLRFTGSEVWKDSNAVVFEILRIVQIKGDAERGE